MKKLMLAILAICSFAVSAQNLRTPAPSPTQTISQDFALSSIQINYSRPAMKGRKIFGDLVPFGAIWRTGANGPTTVSFGEDVSVGGKAVKAGKYNLISIPNKSEWTIILVKEDQNAFNYKEGSDVARFTVPAKSLPFEVENFTIMLSDQTSNSVNIELIWSNTYVDIPVVANIEEQIMGQIDNVMNKDNRPYFAAASYYFDNNKDLNKTLEWATKAADAQPDAYWVKHLLAKVQAKAGKKVEAKATALTSKALAEKAGNMDYVRLNENLIKGL